MGRRAILALLITPVLFGCSTLFSKKPAARVETDPSLALSERFERSTFRTNDETLPFRLLRPVTRGSHPLIIFFHGAGERGVNNERTLKHILPFLLRGDVPVEDLFVLVPQCPPGERWVETDWSLPSHTMPAAPSRPVRAVFALLDRLLISESIDASRVYVMGLSMGGFAVWDVLARAPERFAAAIPVCGGGDESTVNRFRSIPLQVFHGARDTTVLPERSRNMVAALRKLGAVVRYTEYAQMGHGSWVPAFQESGLPAWLLAQRRSPALR